jgi:hypothetical protein
MGTGSVFLGLLYVLLQARYLSLAPTCSIVILTTKSTYRNLSAQKLSERTVDVVQADWRQIGVAAVGALSAGVSCDKMLLDKIGVLCNAVTDALYS